MTAREFYDYIMENFNLDGAASRLAHNIIEYVKDQEFVDAEDAQAHLKSLLDGAFGIADHDIKLYRAPECEVCGKYVIDCDEYEDGVLCHHCRSEKGEKEMDEKEFGTEEWAKELVEGLGEMQHNGTGEGFPCPRCGHDRMDDVIVRNALSRYADVYICSQCGTDEALRDMAGKGSLPFLEWGMPMGFVNNSDDEDGDDDE